MNHASQKSQNLGDVTAVLADVLFRGADVSGEKCLHATGFGEEISRMAQLRRLNGDSSLQVEDVLLAEQIELPRPPAELVVKEGIVVRP